MHTKLLTTLLVCAGAAVAAPAAQADVYCVKKPSCSGPGTHDAPDLSTALYKAHGTHGTSDVIELGEGEFETGTGFVYDATGEPDNGVRIVGSGAKTVLESSSPSASSPIDVLAVRGTGPGSTSVEPSPSAYRPDSGHRSVVSASATGGRSMSRSTVTSKAR